MSKEEINIKENFTYTKKNPQDQVIFKWQSLLKIPSKNSLVQLFSLFFITFKHLSHTLTLHTLSSLYINGLEEGCAHLPKTLTSTYGMKLKLGPVIPLIKGDDTWHYHPKCYWRTQCGDGFDPPILSDPPSCYPYFSGRMDPSLIHLYVVVILDCFHITPRVWLTVDTDTD